MEWVTVEHTITKNEIGALGFIGDKIAVVATFYDDRDGNYDGKVGLGERIGSLLLGLEGRARVEVLSQAKGHPDIYIRDPSLGQLQGAAIVEFASGMIMDGIYIAYFQTGVKQMCGAIASSLVSNGVAKFFIRTGMEQAVKKAYEASTS